MTRLHLRLHFLLEEMGWGGILACFGGGCLASPGRKPANEDSSKHMNNACGNGLALSGQVLTRKSASPNHRVALGGSALLSSSSPRAVFLHAKALDCEQGMESGDDKHAMASMDSDGPCTPRTVDFLRLVSAHIPGAVGGAAHGQAQQFTHTQLKSSDEGTPDGAPHRHHQIDAASNYSDACHAFRHLAR